MTAKGPKSDASVVKDDGAGGAVIHVFDTVIHVFDTVIMPLTQPNVSNGEGIFFDFFRPTTTLLN